MNDSTIGMGPPPSMTRPDCYHLLGVSSNATQKEIETAYRNLVRTCHPDVCHTPGAEERMKDINGAFEVLSDPEKRRQYDRERVQGMPVHVRRESAGPAGEQPRYDPYYDPRYDPRHKPPPPPMGPWVPASRMPYAAGAVAGLCIFCILLVLFFGGAPQPVPAEPPVIALAPTLLVTPVPLSMHDLSSDKSVRIVTALRNVSRTPGPTQTLPPNLKVFVQIDKDVITKRVTVSLAGGDGQSVVKEIRIRLTRSDRQVLETSIVPEPSLVRNEASIAGTNGGDRAEVVVIYYSGDQYTVIDKLLY